MSHEKHDWVDTGLTVRDMSWSEEAPEEMKDHRFYACSECNEQLLSSPEVLAALERLGST